LFFCGSRPLYQESERWEKTNWTARRVWSGQYFPRYRLPVDVCIIDAIIQTSMGYLTHAAFSCALYNDNIVGGTPHYSSWFNQSSHWLWGQSVIHWQHSERLAVGFCHNFKRSFVECRACFTAQTLVSIHRSYFSRFLIFCQYRNPNITVLYVVDGWAVLYPVLFGNECHRTQAWCRNNYSNCDEPARKRRSTLLCVRQLLVRGLWNRRQSVYAVTGECSSVAVATVSPWGASLLPMPHCCRSV